MSALALSVLLSLVSAVAYAGGAIVQERVAESSPGEQYAPLRRPGWWAAVGLNGLGGLLHVVALAYGPLSLVQPLGALTIVVALPMAALFVGRKAGSTAWRGAIMATVGLAGLLSLVAAADARSLDTAQRVAVAVVTAAAVVALTIAARAAHRHPAVRSMLLATASGVAFGMSSVFTKTVAVDWTGGVSPADVPSLAVIGVLATAGMLLSQASYRGAGLAAPLATLTVVNPVVAAAVGITMFGETFRYGTTGTVLALSCGVVAAGGLILLTTERLAQDRPERAGTGLEVAGTGLVPADTGLADRDLTTPVILPGPARGTAGGGKRLPEPVGAVSGSGGSLAGVVGSLPGSGVGPSDPSVVPRDDLLAVVGTSLQGLGASASLEGLGASAGPVGASPGAGALSESVGALPGVGGAMPDTGGAMPGSEGAMPGRRGAIAPENPRAAVGSRTAGAAPAGAAAPRTAGLPVAVGTLAETTRAQPETGVALPETVGAPPIAVGTLAETTDTLPGSTGTGTPSDTRGTLPETVGAPPIAVGSLSKALGGAGGARAGGTGAGRDGEEPVSVPRPLAADGLRAGPDVTYESGEASADSDERVLSYVPFFGIPYVALPTVDRHRRRVRS
ncbi:hypothetical protein GCM10023086_54740 [Streptomyces venetus]|uniref:DMT family transporter n=1 Tax=Streptomyces venetus TaxID=1701086 RepID=A0ABP8GM92_9ACTN